MIGGFISSGIGLLLYDREFYYDLTGLHVYCYCAIDILSLWWSIWNFDWLPFFVNIRSFDLVGWSHVLSVYMGILIRILVWYTCMLKKIVDPASIKEV